MLDNADKSEFLPTVKCCVCPNAKHIPQGWISKNRSLMDVARWLACKTEAEARLAGHVGGNIMLLKNKIAEQSNTIAMQLQTMTQQRQALDAHHQKIAELQQQLENQQLQLAVQERVNRLLQGRTEQLEACIPPPPGFESAVPPPFTFRPLVPPPLGFAPPKPPAAIVRPIAVRPPPPPSAATERHHLGDTLEVDDDDIEIIV